MNSFMFYNPTKVYFGKGVEDKAGEVLKKLGVQKVLIHYGGGSVVRSGLLQRIKDMLQSSGISYCELGGVKPNPVLSLVRKGIDQCLAEKVDFILAVGGGSTIDSAKAISVGAAHAGEYDVWDFFLRKATPEKRIPLGSVLTIAAAGSETSFNAVITNEDGMLKRGMGFDALRPVFTMMNPELLYTLPPYQIACGVTDVLMHTLDRYFTSQTGNEMTDQIAEGLLRTVFRYGVKFFENPESYEAASEIMWAGSLSHNQLTGLGGRDDFATHQLGHELSALFDAAHGATLAAMWGSWARYVYRENPSRFARYTAQVFGPEHIKPTEEETAQAGIELTEAYFKALSMPTNIPALAGRGLTEEELITATEKCTYFGARTIGSFKVLGRDDIYAIYQAANKHQ